MKLSVQNSTSPLGFSTEGGGVWKVWDRFITFEGQKIYHIGNICGTCGFFFERLSCSNQSLSPQGLQQEITRGVNLLTDSHAMTIKELLPDGDYELSLSRIIPQLVAPGDQDDYFIREAPVLWGIDSFSGLPHNPRTKYYRCPDRKIGEGARLHEFIIPMTSETLLKQERVSEFRKRLDHGECPTALVISVLDIKQPAEWEDDIDVNCHWCLAHYLIDGHHKVSAASLARRPISLISMLALDKGISGPEDCAKVIREINLSRST